jgi:aspartate 1-decarboxylase
MKTERDHSHVAVRRMFKSKLHRATVTATEIDYEGSVTLDRELMAAADIWQFEEVHIWNVTRGSRFTTYALEGEAGSGIVCINGAAAHLVEPGDIVIIATFAEMPEDVARRHQPKVVLLDAQTAIEQVELQGPVGK